MGGRNSGRRTGKRTTDLMHDLDIRKIQRSGLLVPNRTFGWQWTRRGKVISSITLRTGWDAPLTKVTLDYRTRPVGEEWKDMSYPVYLSWTECNFGGQRVWWICPAQACGRRVAVLYAGSLYACRQCQKLAYRTQREQPSDLAASRAEKIRKRLGWTAGILSGNGGKPKGMHWSTYWRLQSLHTLHAGKSVAAMRAKFGIDK